MEWKCFTQFIQNNKNVHEAVQLPGLHVHLPSRHSTRVFELALSEKNQDMRTMG